MDFKISDVEVAMLWKEDRVGYQIKISFNHNKVTTYTDLSNDLNLFNEFNKYRKEYGQDFYDVLFLKNNFSKDILEIRQQSLNETERPPL